MTEKFILIVADNPDNLNIQGIEVVAVVKNPTDDWFEEKVKLKAEIVIDEPLSQKEKDSILKNMAAVSQRIGPVGCGAVCKHGHNELTCHECMPGIR